MDMKTLIHVGVEVVVIGGITFHFQRKISKLEGELQLMRDENLKMREEMKMLARVISAHDEFLRGGNANMMRTSQQQHPRQQSFSNVKQQHEPSPIPKQTTINEEEEEEEIPDEELDALLGEELSDLKEKTQDFIELDCSEDICDISSSKKKSKKKVLSPEIKENGRN
jgi:hypothetical protein